MKKKTVRRKKEKEVTVKDIRYAPYNPRSMDNKTKKALAESLKEFSDISGITINKKTNNIITGNHRWELINKQYKPDDLEFSHLSGEYYILTNKTIPTPYVIRMVDWDENKEKAANLAGNSDLLAGKFTDGLQDVLKEINSGFSESFFKGLRFPELQIDFSDADLSWSDEELEKIQKESEQKNRELEKPREEETGNVRMIREEIKISVPTELKERVLFDIYDVVAKKDYYTQIAIH